MNFFICIFQLSVLLQRLNRNPGRPGNLKSIVNICERNRHAPVGTDGFARIFVAVATSFAAPAKETNANKIGKDPEFATIYIAKSLYDTRARGNFD